MKYLFFLFSVLITSQAFCQNYGVVFVAGISGSSDATFGQGYDHDRLVSDLSTILGGTPVFSYPPDFDGSDALNTRATKLRSHLINLNSSNPNKEWFLFGHSMGGVTVAYYDKVIRQIGDPRIKGVISTNAPFSGINTLQESPSSYMEKYNKYFDEVGTGLNGENPYLVSDWTDLFLFPVSWMWDGAPLEFVFGVGVTHAFLYKIRTAGSSSGIFFKNNPAIISLQKTSSQITALNSFTFGSNYRIIGSEDYEYTIFRAAGSHPAYINREKFGETDFSNFLIESFIEGVTEVNGFDGDFKAGPMHAIGVWQGLRQFCDNRVIAYRRSEHRFKTLWDISFHMWTGMKNSMIEARKAKERYIFSRSSIERLDIETQRMANDLNVTTQTVTIHYHVLEPEWAETCQSYYGNDPNEDLLYPNGPSNRSLPSLLGKGICDSPVYRDWDETVIVVTDEKTVATDGIVTVPNQTPKNPGTAFIKVANTDPNDGNNHASAVWVVRPWSGKETETMKEAKEWIRGRVRNQ